jgi:Tol biopolymer transport system component
MKIRSAMLLGVLTLAPPVVAQVPMTRVNVASDGTPIPLSFVSSVPSSSGDGSIVVFGPAAVPPAPGGVPPGVLVRDISAGTTTSVSVGLDGAPADRGASDAVISANGRFVAFVSSSTNLEGPLATPCGRYNQFCSDIYVYDRQTSTLERVTQAMKAAPTDRSSSDPHLSSDGRFVVFASEATNLVPGDTNDAPDIFLFDRTTRTTSRVSVASDGAQAVQLTLQRIARSPVVSDDGRFVSFLSTASNLAPGGRNEGCFVFGIDACPEAFLHDRQTGTTVRISVSSTGQRANYGASEVTMTPDGRTVIFVSVATNLGGVDGSYAQHPTVSDGIPYSHETTTGVTTPSFVRPGSIVLTTSYAPPSISAEGRFVTFYVSGFDVVSRQSTPTASLVLWDREMRTLRNIVGGVGGEPIPPNTYVTSPFLSGNHHALTFVSTETATPIDRADILQIDPLDGDRDGMSNTWEEALGLDPRSSAGLDGPGGDPDGDGASNLDEFSAQSHPRGLPAATRYFAEGATGTFFETRIALANPTAQTARALLRLVDGTGRTLSTTVIVPPRQSRKVPLSQISRLGTAEFATTVESDAPLVAERQMWWSTANAYGSHAERAFAGPSTTWYFAEGATTGGFDLFYLLQNPTSAAATVDVSYLRGNGAPLLKTYVLPAHSRTNIWVDVEEFDGKVALAAAEISAVIEARDGVGIIAERAMYYTAPGTSAPRPFEAGHAAAGVTAPTLSWFLAEGATGSYFDLFVLVANPADAPALVDVEYLLPDGTRIVRPHVVPARSRYSIWVDQEDARLADTAVSTTLRVTNGVGIVVERSMWWPGPTSSSWREAHVSAGSVTTAPRWGVADGVVADAPGTTDTYVLVANTGPDASDVRVTLLFDDGAPETSRVFTVAAGSRFNVDVRTEFPAAVGRGFGVLVESLSDAPLVVERSIYNDADGVRWAAGNNASGSPLP